MVTLKSRAEIAKQRDAGLVVCDVLDAVEAACEPGISTFELAEIAEHVMKRGKATSAFLGYAPHGMPPYPSVLCTSVNDVVIHGIPRKDVVLRRGDLVGVDFACFRDGWCADAARTIAVGPPSAAAKKLLDGTRRSLERAIDECRTGRFLRDVSGAVEDALRDDGLGIVREYTGHGIGRAMHEAPSVANHRTPGRGTRLQPGLVLAIEPMATLGSGDTDVLDDDWTVVTADGSLAAHFEHSVAITDGDPIVLTRR
jgi:methionyl aminopeptidase